MNNPFNEVGHIAKVVAVDAAHVVEGAAHVGQDLLKVLQEVRVLTPAFKQELALITSDIEPLLATLGPVILSKGANVVLDVEAVRPVLSDITKLVSDFNQFLPVLKSALLALEQDVQ